MVNLTDGIEQERAFLSHAPGYWAGNGGIAPELWKDWKWQLQNRVTKLGRLEEHLSLSEEERVQLHSLLMRLAEKHEPRCTPFAPPGETSS